MSAILSAADAVQLAERILQARYPHADAGLAAGSFVRGNAVAGSDLDLVVLFAELPNSWRESFLFEGVPVDVFGHDPETLRLYFQKDVDAGRPAMLTMTREGVIVGPKPVVAEALKTEAETIYAKGPPPFEGANLERWRYLITDRIGDLKDARPWPEHQGTVSWLYEVLAEFILRANGRWAAMAKWTPRTLAAFDPAIGGAFNAAFEAAFERRDLEPLIGFGEAALAPYGGPLFDGYTAQGEGVAKPASQSSSPAGAAEPRNAGDP